MKTNLTYNELNAKHQREHNARLRSIDPGQFKKTQAEKCENIEESELNANVNLIQL